MPPRIARSSVQIAAPKTAKNKNRKRNLDAYSIASHSAPDKKRIQSSRLGEVLDDGPRPKRQRRDDDEEENGEDDEREAGPAKRRRADDEDEEEGSDSSGNEWTLGGMKEDDSDSELDSDEAFGESDEEKFEGFAFRGSKSGGVVNKKSKKKQNSRLQEDEENDMELDEAESSNDEEDEDDFGDDGVDLATILDDHDEEVLGGKDNTDRELGEESASEDLGSDPPSDFDSDDNNDSNEEEKVARMRDRLSALDPSTSTSTTTSQQQQSRAPLTVDDLLSTLDPTTKAQLTSTLKPTRNGKKKSALPKTLTAPLPKRQQDRLNREVASAKAKEQLDRWKDTVVRNRRAEFLEFPLKDTTRGEPEGKEKFVVLDDDEEPQGELEETIRRIMVESGLAGPKKKRGEEDGEAGLIRSEELATNHLPVEEVLRRRAELRRNRDLLFREEIKAKRIAKIKSKSYRRVHRKQRAKERALLGDGGVSGDEDAKERADRKRAEMRMGARYRDSKFAKSIRQTDRAVWDLSAREGVEEEARRREELRRRVQGEKIGDSGSEDSGADDSYGENDDGAGALEQLTGDGEMDVREAERKGLGGLPFMRAAGERQRKRNEEDVERLRKELAVEDGHEGEEEEDEGSGIEDQGLGRAIFGPKGRENSAVTKKHRSKRPEMEEGEDSGDDEDEDDEKEEKGVEIVTEQARPQKTSAQKSVTASGPLARGLQPGSRDPGQVEEAHQGKGSTWLSGSKKEGKPSSWLSAPKKSKMDKKISRAEDDGDGIDVTTLATDGLLRTEQSVPAKTQSQQDGDTPVNADQQASDADQNSDVEVRTDPITTPQESTLHHQEAFAIDADTIKSTFDTEKNDLAASEDEKESSTYLPGWGSWTGAGLSKSIRKSNARARHNPLYKTKLPSATGTVSAEMRKDRKLDNVIVSEKLQPKGTRVYQAPILPHGFETKAQYERSLSLPVGPEWTTKEVFQMGTRPRVVVAPGRVVEAMERPAV